MKPAAFDYIAPETLEHALDLLAQYGDEAKVIAGGQTLGPMLNMRVLAPSVLIDLNNIAELGERHVTDEGLMLGALTRQGELEDDADLGRSQPLVAAAIPHIAHRAIRNRGTVGGSLAHADPAAEWGALVHALGAELMVARKGSAPRLVAAEEFFEGLLTTALGPDELLIGVRLPRWRADAGWSFREFSRRHGDFAMAGVACRVVLDGSGRCREAGLGLVGVSDKPLRASKAEAVLLDGDVGEALFREAAACAAAETDPMEDLHASAAFRRHLVEVLVTDALEEAVQRCTAVSDGKQEL